MSEIKIINSGGQDIQFNSITRTPKQSSNFDRLITEALEMLSQVQNNTESAVKELISAGDITHAILMMEKADMSFQLMIEVRNRLLNAYDEVMRMQV
ncbi:MAG: flagellar hook-basal body complex protein FliE [Thermodesulfovibrionales bacterium]|nr:flagellar hook-basal body complex protein FliE [Thermodesulfovibrionales bacterium]